MMSLEKFITTSPFCDSHIVSQTLITLYKITRLDKSNHVEVSGKSRRWY